MMIQNFHPNAKQVAGYMRALELGFELLERVPTQSNMAVLKLVNKTTGALAYIPPSGVIYFGKMYSMMKASVVIFSEKPFCQ